MGIIQEINYTEYSALVVIFFLMGVLIFGRKNIWNIFDPMLLVILCVVFNVVNIVYFSQNTSINSLYFISSFIAFFYFLRIGVRGSRFRDCISSSIKYFRLGGNPSCYDAKYFLFVAIFLQTIYYIFFYIKAGFAFSGNAGDVKNMIYLNGNGIFKYIGWAGGMIFMPLLVYLHLLGKNRGLVLFAIIWYISCALLFSASKSGLVLMLFDIAIISYYTSFHFGRAILSKKLIFAFVVFGSIPAFFILSYFSRVTNYSIAEFFIIRLIDTGGGSYQYFIAEGSKAFLNMPFIDRVLYFLDTLLSVFRLKEWADPNRMAMVTEYVTGSYQAGFGQNPYMFTDGHYLFGYLGGILYVSFLGYILGLFRSAIQFNIVLYYVFYNTAFAMVGDPDMAQARIVSLLLLTPFYILLRILQNVKYPGFIPAKD